MTEIWKEIYGYDVLYEISNMGRVRTKHHGKFGYQKDYRYIDPIDNGNGYLRLNLKNNHSQKTVYIHRLVATYFLENPNGWPEVNHKDENKHNNHVDNLEWCTRVYNANYGTNLKRGADKRKKPIICVETGIVYGSLQEAADSVNVVRTAIDNCLKGRSKTCSGFRWRYADV